MPIPIGAISMDLLDYLRTLYRLAMRELVCEQNASAGINGFTEHAIPSYITAVAAVESFTHETLVGRIARRLVRRHSGPSAASWEALEEASLREKLLRAPRIHFGRTFVEAEQPYRDVDSLIKIKDSLVHYHMEATIPQRVEDLERRGIAIRTPDASWTTWIQTTEGIRWAHNAACSTVREIIAFADQGSHPLLVEYGRLHGHLLRPITESTARRLRQQLLEAKGQRSD